MIGWCHVFSLAENDCQYAIVVLQRYYNRMDRATVITTVGEGMPEASLSFIHPTHHPQLTKQTSPTLPPSIHPSPPFHPSNPSNRSGSGFCFFCFLFFALHPYSATAGFANHVGSVRGGWAEKGGLFPAIS